MRKQSNWRVKGEGAGRSSRSDFRPLLLSGKPGGVAHLSREACGGAATACISLQFAIEYPSQIRPGDGTLAAPGKFCELSVAVPHCPFDSSLRGYCKLTGLISELPEFKKARRTCSPALPEPHARIARRLSAISQRTVAFSACTRALRLPRSIAPRSPRSLTSMLSSSSHDCICLSSLAKSGTTRRGSWPGSRNAPCTDRILRTPSALRSQRQFRHSAISVVC